MITLPGLALRRTTNKSGTGAVSEGGLLTRAVERVRVLDRQQPINCYLEAAPDAPYCKAIYVYPNSRLLCDN